MNENQYNFNEQILNTLTVQRDGIVTGIRTARSGGQYVKVGPTVYYVPSGYDTIVKARQKLEAGDDLALWKDLANQEANYLAKEKTKQ